MIVRILTVFIFFSVNLVSVAGQSIGLEMPKGKKSVQIPFDFANNFITTKVNFNFIFSLNFIFDTGAEHTILTKREITDITRAPFVRTFKVLGADLQTELVAHLVRNMKIDEIYAPHQDILVLDEDYFRFEEFTGTEVHGIIGADLFKRHAVQFNYRKKTITLYDSASFQTPEDKGYEALDIEIIKNKPYLNTNTYLQNGDTITTKLLIDTGASLSLLLNTFTHPKLQMPENAIKGNIGMGLGGFLEGYKGRIKSLDIGSYNIPNIITNFQELSALKDTTYLNGRNGIIGNEILSRFTYIIDYHNQKLYIKANKDFNKEFKYDRSGITLIAAGPYLKQYIIYSLVENAPSTLAGLQKGDMIKSINFIPTKLLSLKNIADIFHGKIGKKRRLVIKRNGKRMIFTFRLKDLV